MAIIHKLPDTVLGLDYLATISLDEDTRQPARMVQYQFFESSYIAFLVFTFHSMLKQSRLSRFKNHIRLTFFLNDNFIWNKLLVFSYSRSRSQCSTGISPWNRTHRKTTKSIRTRNALARNKLNDCWCDDGLWTEMLSPHGGTLMWILLLGCVGHIA